MKLNESSASRRRVGPLLALTNPGGVAVTGEDFSGVGEKMISVAGAAFVAAAGAILEMGNGYYALQLEATEVETAPWVAVKLDVVCQPVISRGSITQGYEGAIAINEPDADKRRVGPVPAVNSSYVALTTTVGITVQISKNGAAWGAAAGTLTLTENGLLYYNPTVGEVDSAGWLALRFTGTMAETVFREDITAIAGDITAPTITVVSTFGDNFRDNRTTPWQAELDDFPEGADAVIEVHYAERNETYVARSADGEWRWPFDIEPDNAVDLGAVPATVQLLPRGGWPPDDVEIVIGAARQAVES